MVTGSRPVQTLRLLCLLCLLAPALTHAQCPGVTSQQSPFATEVLTLGDAATSLTASIYKPSGITPTIAILTVEGGPIRYLTFGTPTVTSGHPIDGTPASTVMLCGLETMNGFKAIRVQAVPTTMTVSYYRNKP